MRVGDTEIRVPDEDPVGYEPDWRFRLASRLAETGGVHAGDAEVRKLTMHLKAKAQRRTAWKPTQLDRVLAWRDSETGTLIEAFLAAAPTPAAAAAELGLAAEEVVLYARLIFDIHDGSGTVSPAVLMRLRAEADANPAEDGRARLMKVALASGLNGLRRLLRPIADDGEEQPLDDLVEAELRRRLVAGELRNGDLVRLQANAVARRRLDLETKGGANAEAAEALEVACRILSLTAPAMVRPEADTEREKATDLALRDKFEAQANIALTPVTDLKDKGGDALDSMIRLNFNSTKPK